MHVVGEPLDDALQRRRDGVVVLGRRNNDAVSAGNLVVQQAELEVLVPLEVLVEQRNVINLKDLKLKLLGKMLFDEVQKLSVIGNLRI